MRVTPESTLEKATDSQTCCTSEWEAAYLRFETPEEEIRKFVSRNYWEVHASFLVDAGEYAGKWFNPKHTPNADDKEIKEDRVWNLAEAQAIAQAVKNQTATVTEESKPSSKGSPGLFGNATNAEIFIDNVTVTPN